MKAVLRGKLIIQLPKKQTGESIHQQLDSTSEGSRTKRSKYTQEEQTKRNKLRGETNQGETKITIQKKSTKPGADALRKSTRQINTQPDKVEGTEKVSKLAKSVMKWEI